MGPNMCCLCAPTVPASSLKIRSGSLREADAPLPNKRLKLAARVDYGMNLFFSAPQLKRDSLGSMNMLNDREEQVFPPASRRSQVLIGLLLLAFTVLADIYAVRDFVWI